jgi:hypothetical protein
MTYKITGLDPSQFSHFIGRSDDHLAAHNAVRVTAGADRGYPCRVSLEDAKAGETLILLHHVSHNVATPYRSAYAIYIRENADRAAVFEDRTPPVFEGRPLGLRGFASDGNLKHAMLALPGEADAKIRQLLADPAIAYIDAHNAAHGCFAARVGRS